MGLTELVPTLTRREFQILELIASGYSAKEVALQCEIGHRTVEAHLDTMRLKLRARNRTHMVAVAVSSNLLVQAVDRLGAPSLVSRAAGGELVHEVTR